MDSERSPTEKGIADPAFEKHFRLRELADLWRLGYETLRQIAKDEPGVARITRKGLNRHYTTYSIPESVAKRIHTRLTHLGTSSTRHDQKGHPVLRRASG